MSEEIRELIATLTVRFVASLVVAAVVYEVCHRYGLGAHWAAFVAAGVGAAAGVVASELIRGQA